MGIGDNIKQLRTDHGLSQEELGTIAGVTDKAVSSWELGNSTPRMGAIEKICAHFNIPKSAIVDDTPQSVLGKAVAAGLVAGAALPIGGIAPALAASVAAVGAMMEKKDPAPGTQDDAVSGKERRVLAWFRSLSPEKRQALLSLGDAPEELRDEWDH